MNSLIKVAADYNSSGLWDEQGHCIDVNDVNITDDLKERLDVYVSAYECNDIFLELDDYKERRLVVDDGGQMGRRACLRGAGRM